jgi:hypothetical protein
MMSISPSHHANRRPNLKQSPSVSPWDQRGWGSIPIIAGQPNGLRSAMLKAVGIGLAR